MANSADLAVAGVAENATEARQIALVKSKEAGAVRYAQQVVAGAMPPNTLGYKTVNAAGATPLPLTFTQQGQCLYVEVGDSTHIALRVEAHDFSQYAWGTEFTSMTIQPFVTENIDFVDYIVATLPAITLPAASGWGQIATLTVALAPLIVIDTRGCSRIGFAVTELTASAATNITITAVSC